jgi:hypothetical protein
MANPVFQNDLSMGQSDFEGDYYTGRTIKVTGPDCLAIELSIQSLGQAAAGPRCAGANSCRTVSDGEEISFEGR